MIEEISNLRPPSNITHEYLEFGNVFKLKWISVESAEAYVIQRFVNETFVTIGITLKNEYIDYEVAGFSYDDVVSHTYRIASLRHTSQTAERFSSEYPVSLSYMPESISKFSEYCDSSNSDLIEVNFNKEMKLLVQDKEESLDFYKYSSMESDEKNLISPFYNYTMITSPDKVVQVLDNNDSDYIFLKYKNSNIIALSAEDLSRKVFITDFYGTVTGKFDVDFKNNLLGIIDSTSSFITVLKINGNITVRISTPVKLELGKEKNILDFNIINSKLFVLDYFGRLHVYLIDKDQETITLENTLFDNEDLINNYDLFYKRAFQLKNLIDLSIADFSELIFDNGLTVLEKNNLRSYFLGKRESYITNPETGEKTFFQDPIKKVLKDFSFWLNQNAYLNVLNYNSVLNKSKEIIDSIFGFYLENDMFLENRPSDLKINSLKNYLKDSEYLKFFSNRIVSIYPKLVEYEKRYLDETKIIHSELNNQLIIIGPYFYKLLDLNIYKMQNYFHTLFSSGDIKNRSVLELVEPTSFSVDDSIDVRLEKKIKKAWHSDIIDRFIDSYDTNKELESLSVCFEDLRFEPYLDKNNSTIIHKYDFSEKYLDLYKINFSSVFDVPEKLDFTFFSGFGFPSVFTYLNSIQINKGSYYFYAGEGYKCLITRLRSERENKTSEELIIEEIQNGFLEKLSSDYFNSLNLTTRVWYNHKKTEFTEPRIFSLFKNVNTFVDTSIAPPYSFLNDKELFTTAMLLPHSDIKVKTKIDNFNSTVLFISYGTELNSSGKTMASLTTFHNFYIDTYFSLNEEFSLKRASYNDGEFNGSIKASDDPGVFFISFTDSSGDNYISAFSFFQEAFDTANFKKIKVQNKNAFFDHIYSYWTKYIRTVSSGENKDFLIFNDVKSEIGQYQEFYGNQPKVVWRWERNKKVVSEDGFLAFRISINKNRWVYLNKTVRSYCFNDELSDGTHLFYLQYQNKQGIWSENIICKYYLKTIKPSVPVLSKVEKADGDNSKPVFYWTSEPDTSYFKVIYDKKIEYITKNNFHSPDETFISYNKYDNITMNVISFDKYGNQSLPADWLFTAKAKFDKGLEINYDKYTSNTMPFVTWRTVKDSSSVSLLYYRFDNSAWKSTENTFFQPESDLDDGAHFFEIFYYDSLKNKSDVNVYYFEVNTKAAGIPTLTEETKERTKKCSFNNLFFEFNYDQSDFRMFYSFDNFKTEYEFFNYFLDLSDKNIKTGNKTIFFRYLDKFGNYSIPLEYCFLLQEKSDLKPIFSVFDQITNSLRPKWHWKNVFETEYVFLRLSKDNKDIYFVDKYLKNYFQPDFDLGDGTYTLTLVAVDKNGNSSDEVSKEISIDTKIPTKPILKNKFNKDNHFFFSFEKNDNELYFKISKLDENQNNVWMKLDDNNSISLELNKGTNYFCSCKAFGKNNLWSEELCFSFTTPYESFIDSSYVFEKDGVFYKIFFSNIDGNYKIEPQNQDITVSVSGNLYSSDVSLSDSFTEISVIKKMDGVAIETKN